MTDLGRLRFIICCLMADDYEHSQYKDLHGYRFKPNSHNFVSACYIAW
jgi:hypothetical protein